MAFDSNLIAEQSMNDLMGSVVPVTPDGTSPTVNAMFQTPTTGQTFIQPNIVGGTMEYASYRSAQTGARVEILPPDDNTIGLVVYDDTNTSIFKALVFGTDVGDIIMGNYAGGQGCKWDKSAGVFSVLGTITATLGSIGGWSISAAAIYFDGATDALSAGMAPADYPFYAGKKYADRATAPLRITPAGALYASSVEVTGKITAGVGSSIASDYLSGIIAQANLNVSNRGWVQTSVFSLNGSTPATQVDWAAGTFTSADGTAYSIGAGNTGVMSAKTYIYLDTAVSTTAYQKTTTATTAVGVGKVLVAIAQNGTGEATYTVLGGQGGLNIDASNIVALSITANEIAASTITSGKLSVSQLSAIAADLGAITAGTITLPNTGYIRGGQTDYQTGTGFFLGYSGAAYKFSIGNPAGHYLAWSGANDKLDLKSDIIVDAIFYNKRYIYTAFESLDGWVQSKSGTGNIAPNLGEFYLDTGSTISSIADVHCESFQEGTAINFAKNPYFQTAIRLSAITNQTIYITNGSYDLDGFGFKISNGTLYSLHIKDGTEYTTEITGITLTNWNTYKVSYTSGTNIKFYVNDVLKVTATTNLPVATDVLERFRYSITNTAAERKYLFAQYLLLNQDL